VSTAAAAALLIFFSVDHRASETWVLARGVVRVTWDRSLRALLPRRCRMRHARSPDCCC
jgi:hypothetical protein